MIGILGGFFGGISAGIFIFILNSAQHLRELNPKWIFILPLVGLLIRYLYRHWNRGFLEAPTLLISSFMTHLAGGSAGREGAIIHTSRIFAESIGRRLKFTPRNQKKIVLVSLGAGFGAALGAPIAGIIFGFEYSKSSFFRIRTLFHSVIACLVASLLVRVMNVPHFHFQHFEIPAIEIKTFVLVLILGLLFGFLTSLYHLLRHLVEQNMKKISPYLIGFMGGLFLLGMYLCLNLNAYQGLGLDTVYASAQSIFSLSVPLKKAILTAITLGSGFQGGEFVPLAYMGSTFGSAFSFSNPSLTALMAALGYVSTYAASAEVPLACAILAAEIFGWNIFPYAIASTWLASRVHDQLVRNKSILHETTQDL